MDPLTQNEIDDKLTSVSFGFKNAYDYHYKVSSCHVVKDITRPTLFMTALDDPIVIKECIDFESIKANPNCTIATSEYGGHMGYYENPLSSM